MDVHKIQYSASGRAKSPSTKKDFAVNAYFYLEVEGEDLPTARKNGLPEAQSLGVSKLWEKAISRYPDAQLYSCTVR